MAIDDMLDEVSDASLASVERAAVEAFRAYGTGLGGERIVLLLEGYDGVGYDAVHDDVYLLDLPEGVEGRFPFPQDHPYVVLGCRKVDAHDADTQALPQSTLGAAARAGAVDAVLLDPCDGGGLLRACRLAQDSPYLRTYLEEYRELRALSHDFLAEARGSPGPYS